MSLRLGRKDSEVDSASALTSFKDEFSNISAPVEKGMERIKLENLASKESTAVIRSKVVLYTVLFLAAAAVGLATYFYLRNEEDDNFESNFNSLATEIIDTVQEKLDQSAGVINALSVAITSHLVDNQMQYPFVLLPNFEYRGEEMRRLARAEFIAVDALVASSVKSIFERYASEQQGWIKEGLGYFGKTNVDPGQITGIKKAEVEDTLIITNNPVLVPPEVGGDGKMYFLKPLWQMSPAPMNASVVMQDLIDVSWYRGASIQSWIDNRGVLSKVVDVNFLTQASIEDDEDERKEPRSVLVFPYNRDFGISLGGHILAVLPWKMQFANILPAGQNGFIAVVDDGCGTVFTYQINGPDAVFRGYGDLHDSAFDRLKRQMTVQKFNKFDGRIPQVTALTEVEIEMCQYSLEVYPSATSESEFESNQPVLYAIIVVLVFIFTAGVFMLYEYAVKRRQDRVMTTAAKTSMIVSSLFPENVQQRIFDEARGNSNENQTKKRAFNFGPKQNLKEFLDDGEKSRDSIIAFKTKPIADLFPETTIMFADMVGFTAWSSAREPASVFTLLETIYHAFDEIARRRRVFKVETVGDCYVAVAGLPEPRKDHAVVMARFARDCLTRMNQLTNMLEETLGPDTADLGLRIGLHSGPVTAGVLRGERARFQLFGDTMNTTSRMESTGERDRIQISQDTANLLIAAGKGTWLRRRADRVVAKGKGELVTYWLEIKGDGLATQSSAGSSNQDREDEVLPPIAEEPIEVPIENNQNRQELSNKHVRLINWNTDILAGLLQQIIARRKAAGIEADPEEELKAAESKKSNKLILDEVVEVITLPQFRAASEDHNAPMIVLGETVRAQLHDYVQDIALLYLDNPFHNFEHVSHVTMSVVKLLGRIIAPEIKQTSEDGLATQKTLHDHTYGITSDPLTQFAVVFSALIHDVEHSGVPNAQLVKEQSPVAVAYKNKSVAEQNSVDVAWKMLMDPRFEALRRTIYVNVDEFKRFRQLVVNAVMATDIIDKDLGAARKARWNKAFAGGEEQEDTEVDVNRKATIVIEHLIQASDVAHTMQHWHIYRKWNTRLFQEMYKAYQYGRSEKDPSEFWFEGELGFFDHYIIPLAKKLKDCGVFGVSSDEYLTYAMQNRREWESRGRDVVAELKEGVSRRNVRQ